MYLIARDLFFSVVWETVKFFNRFSVHRELEGWKTRAFIYRVDFLAD